MKIPSRRVLLLLLAALGIALVGTAGWRWLVNKPEVGSEVAACQPVEPGEGFEKANERNLSGELRKDTFFRAGGEYTVESNAALTVPRNVTLIIEPGAKVRFGEGARLVVEGSLLACGKRSRPILFTGDTATGRPGYWTGVVISSAEDTVIGHARFEYGGRDAHAPLWVENTDLHLEDLVFDSNQWYAISLDLNSDPRVRSSIGVKNGPLGWEIRGGMLEADRSWTADYPYIINGEVEIGEKGSLTIAQGSIIRFLPGSGLRSMGSFVAVGTESNPILFTSAYDAKEETSREPQPGDWAGLQFIGRKAEIRLEHVEMRYAGGVWGGCLWLSDASPVMRAVHVVDCAAFSLSTDIASELDIERVEFSESDLTRWWEIRTSALQSRTSRQLHMTYVDDNTLLLPVVTGVVSVEEGAELTLEPGTTMLFRGEGTGLLVDGGLIVKGSEKDPVLLTSWLDETVGGEGGASPGDWGGVLLRNSRPEDVVISNLLLRYAGSGEPKNNGCLMLEEASPKILGLAVSHCAAYPMSSDASSAPGLEKLDFISNDLSNQWEISSSTLKENREWQWDSIISLQGEPILRNITGQVLVDEEATLRLEPGLVLTFSEEAALVAKGALLAEGNPEQPILLTSWRDQEVFDDRGGAQPGDWLGLILDGARGSKKLRNVEIRYAGSERHKLGCLTLNNASPSLSQVSLTACENYPISSDLSSDPTVDELTLSGNQPADAWAIRESNLEAGARRTWSILEYGGGERALPRVVLGQLTIMEGASLKLEAGVVTQFSEGTNLRVHGTITIEGKPGEPVILTSWRDPEFSSQNAAQAGDWGGVLFDRSDGNNALNHLEIRYAGGRGNPQGAIAFVDSSARLVDLTVRDSAWYPISISPEVDIQLERINLLDNIPANGVEVRGGVLDEAGEKVWSPWNDVDGHQVVRVVTGDLVIDKDATLRIDPGTVIKLGEWGSIEVKGGFISSDAVFTSLGDDEYGGDTDGPTESKLIWKGLRIVGSGIVKIDNTLVRYAQNGLWLEDASPQLQNLRIEDGAEAAISTDLTSIPVIEGIVLSGNAINGMVLRAGSLPDGDTGWNVLGSREDQVVRVVEGKITVGSNAQLTIDPGVVIKFGSQGEIAIEGQLQAGERGGEEVIFTSLEDDSVGGDTDNSQKTPSRGGWKGLIVNPNKTGAKLALLNVNIHYAVNGLYLVDLPEWEYEGVLIQNSQYYGISCDARTMFVTGDANLVLLDNGDETLACPTPDRQ